jgi:hypothetical protein
MHKTTQRATTSRRNRSTTAAAATPAAAPTASAAAPAAGVERRADDGAGGQTSDRAEGEPGAGAHPAGAPGPARVLLRVRVPGSRRLRRVAVPPGRGRRVLPLSLPVVVDVVVVPGRLLGALRAPERRDGCHGHRRSHREGHHRHGAELGVLRGEGGGSAAR